MFKVKHQATGFTALKGMSRNLGSWWNQSPSSLFSVPCLNPNPKWSRKHPQVNTNSKLQTSHSCPEKLRLALNVSWRRKSRYTKQCLDFLIHLPTIHPFLFLFSPRLRVLVWWRGQGFSTWCSGPIPTLLWGVSIFPSISHLIEHSEGNLWVN